MVYCSEPLRVGPNVLMASAVLRLDVEKVGGTDVRKMYIHHDSAHAAFGVTDVVLQGPNIRVLTSKPGPVLTAFAIPDETITGRRGVVMGISGGGPGSDIWFYSIAEHRRLMMDVMDDYKKVAHTYANIWFEIKWYVPEDPANAPS